MLTEPLIEDDDAKELVRVVRTPRTVISTQRVDDLLIEQSVAPRRADALSETIAKRGRSIEVRVELAHVERKWRIEPTLRQVCSCLWKHLSEGIPKNGLRAQPAHFIRKGDVERSFNEVVVQQRNTNFKARRHASAIRILEQIVDEKGSRVDMQKTIALVRQIAILHQSAQPARCRRGATGRPQQGATPFVFEKISPICEALNGISIVAVQKFSDSPQMHTLMRIA